MFTKNMSKHATLLNEGIFIVSLGGRALRESKSILALMTSTVWKDLWKNLVWTCITIRSGTIGLSLVVTTNIIAVIFDNTIIIWPELPVALTRPSSKVLTILGTKASHWPGPSIWEYSTKKVVTQLGSCRADLSLVPTRFSPRRLCPRLFSFFLLFFQRAFVLWQTRAVFLTDLRMLI